MMRALCVGGPLDGKEKASEEEYWHFCSTEPLPVEVWKDRLSQDIASASVCVVYHVYQFERTGPRAGVWKYLGRK